MKKIDVYKRQILYAKLIKTGISQPMLEMANSDSSVMEEKLKTPASTKFMQYVLIQAE